MISAVLQGLLRHVGQRSIVVVTDRYPPHAHGGAELSLHTILAALESKGDLLVVTFEDRILVPRRYLIDGIEVLALPRAGAWPFHDVPRRVVKNFSYLPDVMVNRLRVSRERSSLRASPSLNDEDRSLLMKAHHQLHPRGGVVADFVEYEDGLAISLLRQALRAIDPELIHADNYRSILAVSVAAEGLRAKRLGTVRDNRFHCVRYDQSLMVGNERCGRCELACAAEDLKERPELQRYLLTRTRDFRQSRLKSMDRVIVTSRYLENEISALVDRTRVTRIPNAPEALDTAIEHMRGVAELPGINILLVGMLTENKGQYQFVRHLDQLLAKVPSATVHIAGRGARVARKIREVAARKGHSERVVLHGYVGRERLYELYRECQIVAIPVRWPEPFGRVPLEAALARRPVVAFAVGGLVESIADGETGRLVDAGDFGAMLSAIQALAEDPELRQRQGEAALQRVLSLYDIGELKQRLTQTWAELLGRPLEHPG